jgi:hypothetical protein
MSINDMTIGEFKELQSIFGGNNSKGHFVEAGKAYLFRTVTCIELGLVTEVRGEHVKIEQASWIADTGRYHDALRDGIETQSNSEIEPYPDYDIVNMGAVVNYAPYNHPLPTVQK